MSGEPYRILIVDDSPEDREAYRRWIMPAGGGPARPYCFLEADSGEEGLRLCGGERPDCVLLDYSLPDLDGLEFLARLRDEQGELAPPVVMLTGQGSEAVAVGALKQG